MNRAAMASKLLTIWPPVSISGDRRVIGMAERKDRTGRNRRAGGLGDDGADVALVAFVALLIDRTGIKRGGQEPSA